MNFFDKYKNNLEQYYNSDVIIKVINGGIVNIPPNLEKMFMIYKSRGDDIEAINSETHENYIKSMNAAKKRLFNRQSPDLVDFLDRVIHHFVRKT